MASTSPRNVQSHCIAVGMLHFVPGTLVRPENLSPGAIEFLDIMKQATGINMKPIQPHQIFNFDCSSYYAFAGMQIDDSQNDEWVQVSSEAVA